MARLQLSFFYASDGTAIGNLEAIDCMFPLAAGQLVEFAGEFNSDEINAWRVSHMRHIFIRDHGELVQQVDVFLSPDHPIV